ncbi:unnamed protein product [Macrosiphum euphorbiae]|uniref:Secreted protein n=1 Tax=Macrosiphum euphorbiae TaxID=13131 RepID=A0AAV0Y9D3_9HEMI|nr:unnamed protein product [Macrosiphum euphorbiae]
MFLCSWPGLKASRPRDSYCTSFSLWCSGGCSVPLLVSQFSFCLRPCVLSSFRDPLESLRRVGVCVCSPYFLSHPDDGKSLNLTFCLQFRYGCNIENLSYQYICWIAH